MSGLTTIFQMAALRYPNFEKLFRGDWSDYASHSEADLALISEISKISGTEADALEIWRRSKLWRKDKCEGREDYVTRTLEKVYDRR